MTRTVVPVDDKLDLPDPEIIADACNLVAICMEHPEPDAERALVVLRRPGTADVSDADESIFRVMSAEAAGRDTTPWAFYVTGPDGFREATASTDGMS